MLSQGKFEYQNSKSETNSNFQNYNVQNVLYFDHLYFGIVSNFDIRALNLRFKNYFLRRRLFLCQGPASLEALSYQTFCETSQVLTQA